MKFLKGMLRVNKFKFLTLYFSSIGLKQSLQNLVGLLRMPFNNEEELRLTFHSNFSARFNNKPVFSYSSARASLCACLQALGIQKGDEVLISSFTCLAVPTAVIAAGASPKYYDIDPDTMNAEKESLNKLISEKTKAIVIQHTLGITVSIDAIKDFLPNKNIIIIEDCALSIGSTLDKKLIGTQADAAIFSLELSKTISCGWGGVLLLNNKQLEIKVRRHYEGVGNIRLLKSLRMAIQTSLSGVLYSSNMYFLGKYFIALFFKLGFFGASTPNIEERGEVEEDFISKLPKSLVPLAIIQITRFEEITSIHAEYSLSIRSKLNKLNYHVLGSYSDQDFSVSPRVPFLVKDKIFFIDFFKERGIEVGTWFDGPLSPLPKESIFGYDKANYPNSCFIAKHIVNLPCHAKMRSYHLTLIEDSLVDFALSHPDHSDF